MAQGWRKLYKETLNLHTLPLIIRAVRWAEHVERKTMLVAGSEDKRQFGRQ